MTFTIRPLLVNSITYEPVIPAQHLSIDQVKEYMKTHPLPEATLYGESDLIDDMQTETPLELNEKFMGEKVVRYIIRMVNELIK